MLAPRSASRLRTGREAKAFCVALRLIDGGGDVLVAALRFHYPHQMGVDEERIVCRPAICRPFGDRHGAALGRTVSFSIANIDAVSFPTTVTQLPIYDRSGGRFVERDSCGCLLDEGQRFCLLLRWSRS